MPWLLADGPGSWSGPRFQPETGTWAGLQTGESDSTRAWYSGGTRAWNSPGHAERARSTLDGRARESKETGMATCRWGVHSPCRGVDLYSRLCDQKPDAAPWVPDIRPTQHWPRNQRSREASCSGLQIL